MSLPGRVNRAQEEISMNKNEQDVAEQEQPQPLEPPYQPPQPPYQPPQPPLKGFGAQLLAAREQQGFSVGDMVGRIHISVRQLRALESEKLEDLPEPVYVRGFIRSYAKSLGIDHKPLVEDFNRRYGDSFSIGSHQIPEVAYSSEQVFQDKNPSPWWRLVGLLILVSAIAAGIWAIVSQDMLKGFTDNEPVPPRPAVQNEEVRREPVKQAVAPKPQPAAQRQSVQPAPAPAPVPPPKPEPPVIKAQENVPGIVLQADDSTDAAPQSDRKEVRIRLSVKQECWVRISRVGDDSTVFEQEVPAGATRSIRSTKPLRVIIGNSEDVEVELNDVLFDYKRFISPRDKTVRFRMY